MSGQRAKDMRWYKDKRVDDGIMRHPADSEEWKEFDLQHPDFASFYPILPSHISVYYECIWPFWAFFETMY